MEIYESMEIVSKIYNMFNGYIEGQKFRFARFMYKWIKKPFIYNTHDTLDFIINNKCSLSRFGDGEFSIVLGGSIPFQKYNKELQHKLQIILKNEKENHLTCIPFAILDTSLFNKNAQDFWKNFNINFLFFLSLKMNCKKKYFDSQITRFYIDYENKYNSLLISEKLKQIWNNQNILFVEGEKSRLGIGNDLFANAFSIRRIIAPSENAFDQYETIITAVKEKASKKDLVLIALGPTATALAWDLSKLGYWAVDIGHVDVEYEWMLMKATEKVAVKNKFVGDILAFNQEENEFLNEYENSIIRIIN